MSTLTDMLPASLDTLLLSRNRKRWAQRLFWASGACLAILLTYAFAHISGAQPTELDPRYVLLMMLGTLCLLVMLGTIVFRDAYALFKSAKQGVVGTRLQRRILTMFCAVSIVPTLIVALFSILFFNIGVKNWFDEQVSHSLQASHSVAKAYLEEHKNAIRTDANVIADEIRTKLPMLGVNPPLFEQILSTQASLRNISEAIIFERNNVIARTALSFSLIFERLPEEVLSRADEQHIVILSQDDDKIQGVIRLTQTPPLYLLVTRQVDPAVISHMKTARDSMKRYRMLQNDMAAMQVQFLITFCMLALLMLLASTWAGMRLAVRIIGPIAQLNAATVRVSSGDYSIKVPEGPSHDEIANLGRTFNRMTEQLQTQRDELMEATKQMMQAQRTAAWGDVARRIAHEIKNPLTPITLSTERLRKKFGAQISEDKEGYLRYLDTISRHVRDIGKMVEEFVNFARMPTAILKPESLNLLLKKVVFSEQTAHPEIRYQLELPENSPTLECDERLLSQALLNLLKNAAEAFEALPENHPRRITLRVETSPETITLTIHDNGNGFPADKLDSLTEPYVTTRAKGTGLGLAIVKKTMEDHRAELTLRNHPDGGAEVVMVFQVSGSKFQNLSAEI